MTTPDRTDCLEADRPVGARAVEILRVRDAVEPATDFVVEEAPVALVYNGISHAVMMTTPSMLREFAVGFSLAEGIVASPSEIYEIEVTDA